MEGNRSEGERALLEKVAQVRKKKGGVDPAIIICRDQNQPIQIILKSVKPPIITGDYVSVSVSDNDFGRILRVFQQVQESGVSLSRKFQPAEGGVAHSKMEIYNTLEMVERLIGDIYGVEEFFRNQIPSRFKSIPPLEKIHAIVFKKWQQDASVLERKPHTSVFPLTDNIEWLSNDEFEQNILPFLEAVFLWERNKGLGLATSEFRDTVSKRIRRGDASAFYGHLSEVYVSGLYIYDGWTPLYAEKLEEGKSEKKFEWVFQKDAKNRIGIECKDQRQRMQEQNKVSLVDVEQRVGEAIDKFSTQSTKSFNLQRKTLWLNVTNMRDYAIPSLGELGSVSWRGPRDTIAGILTPNFSLRNKNGEIDGVVLAWRERVKGDNGFDYIQRYVIGGDIDCAADLPHVQPLIHVNPGKHFFIRTYMFPEPQFGTWGPVETLEKT